MARQLHGGGMLPFGSLSTRISGIVRDALGALARLGPKGLASGPVLVAIHWCVQRRLARFARLMARVAAGNVEAGRPAVVRQAGVAKERRRVGARRVSLVPRGWAWAVVMSRETAGFGSQLQALLAEPEVIEVLGRVPQAGAILRPLCRMLAVDVPEVLRPAGWVPRVAKVRKGPLRERWRVGAEGIRFNARTEKWVHFVVRGYVPRTRGPPW